MSGFVSAAEAPRVSADDPDVRAGKEAIAAVLARHKVSGVDYVALAAARAEFGGESCLGWESPAPPVEVQPRAVVVERPVPPPRPPQPTVPAGALVVVERDSEWVDGLYEALRDVDFDTLAKGDITKSALLDRLLAEGYLRRVRSWLVTLSTEYEAGQEFQVFAEVRPNE